MHSSMQNTTNVPIVPKYPLKHRLRWTSTYLANIVQLQKTTKVKEEKNKQKAIYDSPELENILQRCYMSVVHSRWNCCSTLWTLKIIQSESYNHSSWAGRDIKDHLTPTPCNCQAATYQTKLPSALSSLACFFSPWTGWSTLDYLGNVRQGNDLCAILSVPGSFFLFSLKPVRFSEREEFSLHWRFLNIQSVIKTEHLTKKSTQHLQYRIISLIALFTTDKLLLTVLLQMFKATSIHWLLTDSYACTIVFPLKIHCKTLRQFPAPKTKREYNLNLFHCPPHFRKSIVRKTFLRPGFSLATWLYHEEEN